MFGHFEVYKKWQLSENFISFSPLHLLTLILGSGYAKPQPVKDSPQLLCGKNRERLDLCNRSLGTRGFPTASWGRQCQCPWCLYSDAQLSSVERYLFGWVRCCWGSLPVKTFTYVVYWFAEFIQVFPHFLEPGLDNMSSDNLCCWIIQAEWEVGPGNCWSTGADCWSGQK